MRRALLFLLLGRAATTDAQMPTLIPGARLRVEAPGQRREVEGTLLSQTADSLTIAVFSIPTSVASASVSRIKVSQGKSREAGAVRGLKIGAAVGAPIGLVVYAVWFADTTDGRDHSPLAFAAGGVAYCALNGLIHGWWWNRTEKWTTIYTSPTRLSIGRAANGSPTVGLAIRF